MITEKEQDAVAFMANDGAVLRTRRGWKKRLEVISWDWLVLLCRYYNVSVGELMTKEFYDDMIKPE